MTDTTEEKKPLSIFDLCETNTNAEEDGRWFNDVMGPDSGINVKLRRLTSKKSMSVRRRLETEYRKYRKGMAFPDDIGDAILCAQLAEGIVVDWSGILDREGKPITFAPAAARELFTQLPSFRLMITSISADMDNFRIETTEEVVKN